MKRWFILAGITVLLLLGAYLFLSHYAVRWIEPHLQNMAGPGLTVASVDLKTTYLAARKIEYKDPQSRKRFLAIEEVRVYPALLSFFKGEVKIKEFSILRPTFSFFRSRDGVLVGPWPPGKQEDEEGAGKEGKEAKKDPLPIKIVRFRIQEGSIDLEDEMPKGPPTRMELKGLNLEMEDIQFPNIPHPSPFHFYGRIKGKTKEGAVEAKGWLNPETGDMEATLRVQGVEVKTFEPYYRERVSAGIDSGDIDLKAKISLKEKSIDAPGTLELVNLRFKEGGTVFWLPVEDLTFLLQKRGDRVKARFHVKGDMNDPRFSLQENVLNRIAFSLAESLGLPVKSMGETIMGGAGKGTEGFADGLKSIGDFFKKKGK